MNTKAGKKAKTKRRTCRVPGCKSAARSNEVCGTHYNGFWRQVTAGEITWQELVDAGLVGPGRPKSGVRELVAAVKAKRNQSK